MYNITKGFALFPLWRTICLKPTLFEWKCINSQISDVFLRIFQSGDFTTKLKGTRRTHVLKTTIC